MTNRELIPQLEKLPMDAGVAVSYSGNGVQLLDAHYGPPIIVIQSRLTCRDEQWHSAAADAPPLAEGWEQIPAEEREAKAKELIARLAAAVALMPPGACIRPGDPGYEEICKMMGNAKTREREACPGYIMLNKATINAFTDGTVAQYKGEPGYDELRKLATEAKVEGADELPREGWTRIVPKTEMKPPEEGGV